MIVLDKKCGDLGIVSVDGDLGGEDPRTDQVGAEDDAQIILCH